MAAIRSGIGRTARTSVSVNSIGIAHRALGTHTIASVARPESDTSDLYARLTPTRQASRCALITSGWPAPKGRTMLERRAWARAASGPPAARADVRAARARSTCTARCSPSPSGRTRDAGVLFMHNEGFSTMCGHGIIAVVTIALERGLDHAGRRRPRRRSSLDAPAGQIRARARDRSRRGRPARASTRCRSSNVPSFVLASGVPVKLGTRTVPVDVAFGGAFYAIVDAEAAGLPVRAERLTELRADRHGDQARGRVAAHRRASDRTRTDGHLRHDFHGPAHRAGADLRNVTIFAEARSRSIALRHRHVRGARRARRDGPRRRQHGRSCTRASSARRSAPASSSRTSVGDCPAIVPELTGDAWITGEHTFIVQRRRSAAGRI